MHRTVRSSGGIVVKLLACGARCPGFDSGLVATISEIGYLLLPCLEMAERSLKRRKSSKRPTIVMWAEQNWRPNLCLVCPTVIACG